jgi:type VI secretion system secreted protein Hcp
MAEMFLKLDGVEGESLDHAHQNEIELQTWTWNTTNPVRWDLNQGGQSTKVHVHEISLKKACDKSSVTLYQNLVTGKHIKNAKITCRKNDGENKFEYLVVELTDVMIAKVEWTGAGESQTLEENVELSFAEFRLDYKVQGDSGNANGQKTFGFNVQRQQAA